MTKALELAYIYRGDKIESIHHGMVVLFGANGLEKHWGDPSFACYTRSIIKPIQAKLANDLLDNELNDEILAIAMSSHLAEPNQILAVKSLMNLYQVSETDLYCGVCTNSKTKLQSAIENNCSGKHSALIAACKKQDWGINNYHDINHPIQILIHNELLRLSKRSIPFNSGIDGCGIPTFYMPVVEMAEIFYSMINDPGYQKIIQTMRRYPELIGGAKQIDSLLMKYGSNLIAKGGAEGLMMVANLESKQVLVIKILDGSSRAKFTITNHIAKELGWIDRIFVEDFIYNSRNDRVGHIACCLEL